MLKMEMEIVLLQKVKKKPKFNLQNIVFFTVRNTHIYEAFPDKCSTSKGANLDCQEKPLV